MKKIVAREFLISLSALILFFLVVFIWEQSAGRIQQKEYELEKKQKELLNEHSLPFRLSVYYYINGNTRKYDWQGKDKLRNPTNFIEKVKDPDIASELFNEIKEDYSDESKPTDGLNAYTFHQQILNDNSSEKFLPTVLPLEKELDEVRSSIFYRNGMNDNDYVWVLTILIFPLFILRYLVYAVKWSLKQLRA